MDINGTITSVKDLCNNNGCNDNCGLKSDIKAVADQLTSASIVERIDQVADQAQENLANTLNQFNVTQASLNAAQNQAALTNLNSFNALTTSLLQGLNEVGRDASNIAAAQQLSQTVQSAAINSEFCNVKALILQDGDKTRSLINDLRVKELETQLQDAKNMAVNSEQTRQLMENLYYNNGYNNNYRRNGNCGNNYYNYPDHGHGNNGNGNRNNDNK